MAMEVAIDNNESVKIYSKINKPKDMEKEIEKKVAAWNNPRASNNVFYQERNG